MHKRGLLIICSVMLLVACDTMQSGDSTVLSGTVQRVWEDGFRLNTGIRAVNVDTWNVFGDNTRGQVRVGERVRVSGAMSGGEFDATSVSIVGGDSVAAPPSPPDDTGYPERRAP